MQTRMKTFDVPHKGIRNGLSRLSLLAGSTEYSDQTEVEQLHAVGGEIFLLLNTHAQDENDVSLKYLEQKIKGASHHDVEDHIRLHVMQAKLENMLDEIHEGSKTGTDVKTLGADFYSSLANYHSAYLAHMAEEEHVTQQLLWDNFTDEELAGHRIEIMKKLSPDTLLLWFKYIAPAQSHRERVELFKGFKMNAPQELFEKACTVLESALDTAAYKRLMADI